MKLHELTNNEQVPCSIVKRTEKVESFEMMNLKEPSEKIRSAL
jgi:hypothetical protein